MSQSCWHGGGGPSVPFTFAGIDGAPVCGQRYRSENEAVYPPRFLRGNANDSCVPFVGDSPPVDLSDAITILTWLFLGGIELSCLDAADVDDSGSIDITDPIYLLQFVFLGQAPPPSPYPDCGEDPSEDQLGCDVSQPCRRPCRGGVCFGIGILTGPFPEKCISAGERILLEGYNFSSLFSENRAVFTWQGNEVPAEAISIAFGEAPVPCRGRPSQLVVVVPDGIEPRSVHLVLYVRDIAAGALTYDLCEP